MELKPARFYPQVSRVWMLVVLLALMARAGADTTAALFQESSDLYIDALYDESAQAFRQILQESLSAGTLHNLGNAEWQRGDIGQAILAWEHARWPNPFNANTSANLRFARRSAELPDPQLGWHETCSSWLPVSAWAWLACAGFWVAVVAVLLPSIVRWRCVGWVQGLAAIGCGLFLLAGPGILGVESRRQLAVVLPNEVSLRLTPTSTAQVLTKLPAGDIVRIKRKRGAYLYVRTPEGGGWIQQQEAGRIAEMHY